MSRYRPYAAAYAALHRRRLAAAGPGLISGDTVRALIAARCAEGEHQSETDEETGDEVCRFCGTVTDDYSDVAGLIPAATSDPTEDARGETGRG